jgi:hypothetical protein
MRGAPHYRGSKGSGLPKIHAPGPDGGALCGAKRRWGVLTTAGHGCRPEETSCASCKSKLARLPRALESGPSRPRRYVVRPVGDGPRLEHITGSPLAAAKAWATKFGACDRLECSTFEHPRCRTTYWYVNQRGDVRRVGGHWGEP